jgi:hypothetical protein
VKRLIAEKNYHRNMTEKSLENQYLEPWLLHNTDPLVTQITCVTRMCNVAFSILQYNYFLLELKKG